MILRDFIRGVGLVMAFCVTMLGFPFLAIGFTLVCVGDWIDRGLK